jgi:hypothetical protein
MGPIFGLHFYGTRGRLYYNATRRRGPYASSTLATLHNIQCKLRLGNICLLSFIIMLFVPRAASITLAVIVIHLAYGARIASCRIPKDDLQHTLSRPLRHSDRFRCPSRYRRSDIISCGVARVVN